MTETIQGDRIEPADNVSATPPPPFSNLHPLRVGVEAARPIVFERASIKQGLIDLRRRLLNEVAAVDRLLEACA